MTLGGIEAAVSAVDTHLQTNLVAKLAALDAEYADSLILAAPAGYYTYEVVEAQHYPIVEVLGGESVVLHEDGSSVNMAHEVTIIITIQDAVTKTDLRTRMYRYGRAIYELMRDFRSTSAYVVEWGQPAIDFSPLLRRQSNVLGDVQLNTILVLPEVV